MREHYVGTLLARLHREEAPALRTIAAFTPSSRRIAARSACGDGACRLQPRPRRCRHDPARDVVFFRDFYTLDECRDLVLHVQEHPFTLPRIAECLDRLGLRFLQFECPEATMARFKESFPAPDAGADLAAWHRFETAHPDTFKAMYTFWCCRK